MRKFLVVCIFIFAVWVPVNSKINPSNHSIPVTQNYIKVLDDELSENSGLIFWDKLLWTINDSGGENEIYGIDIKTGNVAITVSVQNAVNIDWEDIAQDENYIYIADTGNNTGSRKNLAILKIRKKDISKERKQTVRAEHLHILYSDQEDFSEQMKATKYDCEALISLGDYLYLFTKDWATFHTKVYMVSKLPGTYSISAVDSFNTNGMITGADLSDDNRLLMVGYKDYKSFIWSFTVDSQTFFNQPQYFNLSYMGYAQTEGICYGSKGEVLMSCEAASDYLQQVWVVKIDSLH